MSMTTHQGIAQSAIVARTIALKDDLAGRFARYRVYRRTRGELQMLSDRELKDLGISRSMINGIARDTAYGRD